jgi:hypothetical protein
MRIPGPVWLRVDVPVLAICVLSLGGGSAAAPRAITVSLISDSAPGAPVRHGLGKLKQALLEKKVEFEEAKDPRAARGKILIVDGLGSGAGPASALIGSGGVQVPKTPESLLIRHCAWQEKQALLVTAADDTGLMYALLDIADHIRWAADPEKPLSEIRDTAETPHVAERGLSIYTMQQRHFEDRLHDEAYWTKFLDTLAKNRFNAFEVAFGYETAGYVAPPWPYFVDADGFPDVRVVGLTKEHQERNLKSLKRLIQMVHARGMKMALGSWLQINRPWPAQQLATAPEQGCVWGLTEKNLIPYSKAALANFLTAVSGIDTLMFVIHTESGLLTPEMHDFWNAVYPVLKQYGPNIVYEMHGKELPTDLVESALKLGLKVRVNSKYWAEQLGLPFPPTHIQTRNQMDRRHGYSDWFRYPQDFRLHWVLWTGGTVRVLLWGDPEYVKRFGPTTHFGNAEGFTINEPLATKMHSQPNEMKPFDLLKLQYRYYDYEFERWWHFYQVFGRLSYNPDTPAEVWEREFDSRFGKDAGRYVERALHRASQVLPRIIAYCLPPDGFPTTMGWVEKKHQGDLSAYAKADPGDTQQFQSMEQDALYRVRGEETSKVRPTETSQWFARTAQDVLMLVEEAEKRIGGNRNKEFASTMVDMRMLSNMALYHSRRIPAGVSLAAFNFTQDVNALDDAIAHERRAIEAWQAIVDAAGDVYSDNLMMGLEKYGQTGHWKDELAALRKGLTELERQRAEWKPEPRRLVGRFDFGTGPEKEGYHRVQLGRERTVVTPDASAGRVLRFSWLEPWRLRQSVFTLDIPNGTYELNCVVEDTSPGPKDAGPMWIEANGSSFTDTFTVPAGKRVEKRLDVVVADGKLRVVFESPSNGRWLISAMTLNEVTPLVAHLPVRSIAPAQDLPVRATVSGVDPITSAQVWFGNEESGYSSATMEQTGPSQYRAVIPALHVTPGMKYFIEATDKVGRRGWYPREGAAEAIAPLMTTDKEPPVLLHQPVAKAVPGNPLVITAQVSDPSGVKRVDLRYRGMTQHQDYHTIRMLPTGVKDEYRATVPGEHIQPDWDFMYFFETMDKAGNGRIYPYLEKETPYVVVKVERSAETGASAARVPAGQGR